jgi:hypothetical protein
MHELSVVYPQGLSDLDRQVHHAARVPMGLIVPDVERPRPPLDGQFVGLHDLQMGLPELFEHAGVVDSNGGLVRKRLEEINPLPLSPLRRKRQLLVLGVIKQDRGRIGPELVHHLFDEHIQRQAQVETRGDRPLDSGERALPLELLTDLLLRLPAVCYLVSRAPAPGSSP